MRASLLATALLLAVCLSLSTPTAAKNAERRKSNIPLQPQQQFVPSDIDEANAVYISGKGNAPSAHNKARFASSSAYNSWSHPRFGPLTENELLVSSESKLPPITFKQDTVIDTSGTTHWPMAGVGTRPIQPGYRHPSFRAVNGIRVADMTRVVNQTNLEDDHPDVMAYRKFIADYNKNVWTPNGRIVHPNDTDGVARALALARNSFIVVDVTDRYSHMHVFYIDPQSDNNNRSSLPWRARITRFGKIGGEDQGSSCTGLRNDIDGIPTSLLRGAMLPDKVQRFEHLLAVLTAMYARCKHTVFEALTLPNDDAELGLLRTLNVRRKSGSDLLDRLKSHIEVWFNNVNIHFEGSATYRILQENAAKINNRTNLDTIMWNDVRAIDTVIRNNTGHLTTRVLPGVWQSYFGFIGVRDWLARNKALRSNVNNILYIAYQATINLAVRVGPSRVRLYPRKAINSSEASEASEESSHHEESSEESSHETSFLEVASQTQAKGNVSLIYPLNDNPGTLFCKSFFGMGHYTMMAEILKWHVRTLGESLLPGDRVLVPCLAKGVRIERRKLFSNSVVAHEVCFATHRKYGEPFSEYACEEFSRHKVLVQALSVKNIYFEGTSDHRQCKAVIREFLRGKDLHNIRKPWARQLDPLVRPGGPVDADAKKRIKHIAIASWFFEEVLRTSLKNKYEGVPKYALEFGVSMKQALAIFRSLSGPRFGGANTDDMAPNDWVLPLVGAFSEILLVEKLQFDPEWQGRVYLRRFRWIHGMKEVYADLQATKDARYEQLYDMVQYRVPTRAKDPEDMPYIDDLSLVPSRGYLMAHPEWTPSLSDLESKKQLVKTALARKQRELSKIYTPKQSESSWVTISGSGGAVPISGSLSASAKSSEASSGSSRSSSLSFSESTESGSRESSENSA